MTICDVHSRCLNLGHKLYSHGQQYHSTLLHHAIISVTTLQQLLQCNKYSRGELNERNHLFFIGTEGFWMITGSSRWHSKIKVKFHSFLISAQDGGEWLTSHSGHFTPRKEPWRLLNKRMGGPHSRTVQPAARALHQHHYPGSPEDILWVRNLKKFYALINGVPY